MRIVRIENGWKVLAPGLAGGVCLGVIASRGGYRVGEISDELGCSEAYFRRVFVRDTGISPKQWLKDERMLRARQLLDQGREPWQVAEALGFSSAATFRREFREVYGTLPGRWQGRVEERG